MRARLHNPARRRWIGMTALAVLVSTALLVLVALSSGLTPALSLMAPFWLGALAEPLFGRRSPRAVDLQLGSGRLTIVGNGARARSSRRVIKARDVSGATSARLSATTVLLTLALRGSRTPVSLELASDEDARAVWRVLGVGEAGYGAVAWPTRPGQADSARTVLRVVWRAIALVALAILPFGHDLWALSALCGTAAAFAALGALALRLSAPHYGTPFVQLGGDGIVVGSPGKTVRLAYDQIERAYVAKDRLVIRYRQPAAASTGAPIGPPKELEVPALRSPSSPLGLSFEDATHIAAHISSASGRVDTILAPLPPHLESLRRGEETRTAWLARLDAIAPALIGAGGYRSAQIDEASLWGVVENPDADSEARGAAARILTRAPSPNARARIDEALAAERDVGTQRRIRVSLEEDISTAAEGLEALEPPQVRVRRQNG